MSTRELWLGESVGQAIASPRIHHQLLPDYISYEEDLDKVSFFVIFFNEDEHILQIIKYFLAQIDRNMKNQ